MQTLYTENIPLFYIIITIAGLITGSFLNVVIHRIPVMLREQWMSDCHELLGNTPPGSSSINLFTPRSFCPACNTQIKAWHNIPIVSYIWLKGRCNQCHEPISMKYPLIELLTALLFSMATWYFGFNAHLLASLIFIGILICLFFIDLEHQLLPDSLTFLLMWVGLLANTQEIFTTLPNAVLGAASAYIALWIFIQLYYLITGKIGMGNGDFKLFAALGAWFGWAFLPFIMVFSCITGGITGYIILKWLKKPTETPIPFGPFLCISGLVVLFWGQQLMQWYLG